MKKRFALIGAAGFIAPKHLKAIRDTGNELVLATDIHDSVGILDQFFPETRFTTSLSEFEEILRKYNDSTKEKIDFVVIATPNYLHREHIALSLNSNSNVICEKPLLIKTKDIECLIKLEKESQRKVFTLYQLRLHPKLTALKAKIKSENKNNYKIDLTYITTRGNWYQNSWKGDSKKSGGILYNIGIHFFDLLLYLFGKAQEVELLYNDPKTVKGILKLENAEVNWYLSIDQNILLKSEVTEKQTTNRSLKIDEEEIDFSEGFEDLHTLCYQEILAGNGLRIKQSTLAIELVEKIAMLL